MSEARRCDRCSGFYELSAEDKKNRDYPYYMKGAYVKIMLFDRYGEREDSTRWFDLCPNCMLVLDKWLENPDCVDRSNGATEKELELASKLNEYGCPHDKCFDCAYFSKEPNPFNIHDHKGIYLCKLKKVYISGNCSRPDVSDMTPKDFCNLGCNFVKETIDEPEYKDPCKSCNNGVCEQCVYGYCSEEDKKKRWLENHKEEAKLSDPYEEGGL